MSSFLRGLRPTILDRYVAREVWAPTGLGLLLFTFILLLDQISNLMKILVSRGADLATVVRAFAYLLPSIFSVTIPMAFLLGVLLGFGRMASDSEIVALRASGVSPLRLLRPVVALSVLTGSLTFYVFAILGPAANQAYREIVFALIVSKARTGVVPRVFNDDLLPGGTMVLYVSDISAAENGLWKSVFIHDTRNPQQPKVILAKSGRLVIDRQRQSVGLDLEHAVWYTFRPSSPHEMDSDRGETVYFPFHYEEFFPKLPLAKGDRELTMGELSQRVAELRAQGKGKKDTARFDVEWHKKLAIPTACLVFGLLGLGLSLGSKKEARSAAFGLSVAVIFVYYVLIRLGEQAGDTGLMDPLVAVWGANVVLGIAAVVLLLLNHREAAFDPLDPRHYRALLPAIRRARRPAPAAAAPPRRSGARRGRRVIVLRIPRLQLPIPGLLDRYIARTYLERYALVMTTFLALFVLVEFMDLFDDVQQNHVKGAVVLHYYLFHMPYLVHLITPVAVLVTVLVTFGVMARNNEITAMKAAGLSIYRVVLPALALSALVAFVMFESAEYLLPPVNKVAREDFNVIKGRPPQSASTNEHRWILGHDGRIYNFDYLSLPGDAAGPPALYGLSIYDVDAPSWELRSRLYAARAVWNGVWYDLEQGWSWTFTGGAEPFKQFSQVRQRDLERPTYFVQDQPEADTMSFRDLQEHIRRLQKLGLDVTNLKVSLHRKVSYPAVSLIMTMIGVPFAFVVARRGALYGVAVAIVIAIVYWACLGIFEQLGNNAILPPLLAAWAPNILFGTTGLYFLFTLDT